VTVAPLHCYFTLIPHYDSLNLVVRTAVTRPCTRIEAVNDRNDRTRPYTRTVYVYTPCRRPCKGRIRSHVHGRVHVYTARTRLFHGRIHVYTTVCTAICTGGVHSRYTALHTDRKRVHNPVHDRIQTVYTAMHKPYTRVHGCVHDLEDGRVLGPPHGRLRAVYTAVYTVVYTCIRPYIAVTRPCTRAYVQAVCTAV